MWKNITLAIAVVGMMASCAPEVTQEQKDSYKELQDLSKTYVEMMDSNPLGELAKLDPAYKKYKFAKDNSLEDFSSEFELSGEELSKEIESLVGELKKAVEGMESVDGLFDGSFEEEFSKAIEEGMSQALDSLDNIDIEAMLSDSALNADVE